MFLRLLLLFIFMPILELGLLIEIGQRLGTWVTVALVVGTGLAGASLARSQGSRAFYRLREGLSSGSFPGDELFDGALILAGGLLLLTPGLITDLIGFAALIPGTRHLLKAGLKRTLRQRFERGAIHANYRVD